MEVVNNPINIESADEAYATKSEVNPLSNNHTKIRDGIKQINRL